MEYNQKWHESQDLDSERYRNVIAKNHEIRIRTDKNNVYKYTRSVVNGVTLPEIWNVCKNGVPEEVEAVESALYQTLPNIGPSPVDDLFGESVSIFENTMAIGAPTINGTGVVYIYVKDEGGIWGYQQQITDSNDGLAVGTSVSLCSNTLAIGSRESIYLYVLIGGVWTLEQEIPNPTGGDDNFGKSISLFKDLVITGSPEDDGAGENAGAAYIYVRNEGVWTLEQKILNPSTPQGDGDFGHAVSLFDDTCIITAKTDDNISTFDGTSYVYRRENNIWTLEQEIPNPNAAYTDYFGESASLYGSGDNATIVIGCPYDDPVGNNTGSVYVFTRTGTTWSLEQEINGTITTLYPWFGYSVALYENALVVGVQQDSINATDSGSAFLFEKISGVWTEKQYHINPEPGVNYQFGHSVAIYGDEILVGANQSGTTGSRSGAVYAYNTGLAYEKTVYIAAIDPVLRQFYQDEEIPLEVTIN